jgi:cell division septation protein DedD
MRDLDQLQEQDPDARGRSLVTWLVVGVLLTALAGLGFLIWSRGERAGTPPQDPLDRLAQLAENRHDTRPDAGQPTAARKPLSPDKLTFERALTEDEDRPEVVAALAAAAREEERLAKLQPRRAAEARGVADEPDEEANAGVPASAPLPAGLAASAAAGKLEKSAKHDKLVAAAMPKPARDAMRAAGSGDGEFVLQVISYGARVQADAFANQLREHGHAAFVEVSEVNGRGRTYRVRLGPFRSKPAADAYRREFEEREHMNTIVVRRED